MGENSQNSIRKEPPARHVIIGAGPAGLTTAWELSKASGDVLILEADQEYVGGIARTVEYSGNRFDMGGHRFFSKSEKINRLWAEILPDDFIEVQRLSRIYYRRRFFPYPIKIWPTLKKLGPLDSLRIMLSYLYARCFPREDEKSFEDWIVNRFGYHLYATFFKTYTEKVWGIPGDEISKDFAAQRIRGFSMIEALKNALLPPKNQSGAKTLINKFIYPRLGPGQLWEAVRDLSLSQGARLEHNQQVVRINHHEGRVRSVETEDGSVYEADYFYSTMPLGELIQGLHPAPPREVLHAGSELKFRDFLTVAVIVNQAEVFADNWIYIHDPGVKVGRIQNYKNWSVDMVANPSQTCLGMEYFCSRGETLWEMKDDELLRLAANELEKIGLVNAGECVHGSVVRVMNAYPIYDWNYREHRETIKCWLNQTFKNLYPAGRGGLHNYNSQDHSMMTAIVSVQNMRTNGEFDVWSINTEQEFAEEGLPRQDIEQRLTPLRI